MAGVPFANIGVMQTAAWSGAIGVVLSCVACGGVSDPVGGEQTGGTQSTGGASAKGGTANASAGTDGEGVVTGTGGSYAVGCGETGYGGTGYGGDFSYGGIAGTGVYVPTPPLPPPAWAESCPLEPAAPFESRPLPSGTVDELRAYLDDVRSDMVGHWRGIVTTPWVDPYPVVLGFTADGHYTSVCLVADCVAFYYGTDQDTDLKQYRVETLNIDGISSGEIDVAFGDVDTFGLAAWQGLLEELQIDADAQRMQFDFWRDDGYGPVSFDLWRCSE